MKKNVFALLLAVLMVVSCMTLFVSADESGKAGYVPAASVPTIDGVANEIAWGSVDAIDGIKTLWSDDGFYFEVEADATIKVKEAADATEWMVAVVTGAVTSDAKDVKYAAVGSVVEIFVPYQYYTDEADVWTWYGFVQERTQGDNEDIYGAYKTKTKITVTYNSKNDAGEVVAVETEWEIKQAIEGSNGDYACPTTKANDLIGLTFTMNGKDVEFSMPYCVAITTLNGGEYGVIDHWDDSQVTGCSKTGREAVETSANFQVTNYNGLGFELATFVPADKTGYDTYTCYITTYDHDGNPLPRYGWTPAQLAYASYVSAENAPVIDGVIDAVWGTTAKIYHYNEIDDPLWSAYGYVSILWSDDGIYYMGSVCDTALAYSGTGMDDRINFNITETWNRELAPTAYAQEVSGLSEYGEYEFGIDPVGRLNNGSGFFATLEGFEYAGTVWADNAGYTVEAFVPYLTLKEDDIKIGHVMGLEGSVDDYRDPNGVQGRDEYTNLGGLSSYWSNPQSQFNVIFVGEFDYEDAAMSAADVKQVVNALSLKAQMKADALTADAVDMMISDYVDAAIEEIDIPEVDLTDYAKKSDIPAAQDLSGYALKSEIPALDDYAKLADIPATTLPVILAVVAIVVAAAGIVLQFVKKK